MGSGASLLELADGQKASRHLAHSKTDFYLFLFSFFFPCPQIPFSHGHSVCLDCLFCFNFHAPDLPDARCRKVAESCASRLGRCCNADPHPCCRRNMRQSNVFHRTPSSGSALPFSLAGRTKPVRFHFLSARLCLHYAREREAAKCSCTQGSSSSMIKVRSSEAVLEQAG